jgi:hypothetical protein
MLRSIASIPSLLGIIVIITIIICKYSNSPKIYLLTIILVSIFYQRDTNRKNNKTDNFEETLINVSKFIIVSGIFGYIIVRIVGVFLPGFD